MWIGHHAARATASCTMTPSPHVHLFSLFIRPLNSDNLFFFSFIACCALLWDNSIIDFSGIKPALELPPANHLHRSPAVICLPRGALVSTRFAPVSWPALYSTTVLDS